MKTQTPQALRSRKIPRILLSSAILALLAFDALPAQPPVPTAPTLAAPRLTFRDISLTAFTPIFNHNSGFPQGDGMGRRGLVRLQPGRFVGSVHHRRQGTEQRPLPEQRQRHLHRRGGHGSGSERSGERRRRAGRLRQRRRPGPLPHRRRRLHRHGGHPFPALPQQFHPRGATGHLHRRHRGLRHRRAPEPPGRHRRRHRQRRPSGPLRHGLRQLLSPGAEPAGVQPGEPPQPALPQPRRHDLPEHQRRLQRRHRPGRMPGLLRSFRQRPLHRPLPRQLQRPDSGQPAESLAPGSHSGTERALSEPGRAHLHERGRRLPASALSGCSWALARRISTTIS